MHTHSLTVCAVMEYAEDGDLGLLMAKQWQSGTFFPEARILRWTVQLLLGLEVIHSRRLMHRGISPTK